MRSIHLWTLVSVLAPTFNVVTATPTPLNLGGGSQQDACRGAQEYKAPEDDTQEESHLANFARKNSIVA
ncbi:hypothetical protein Cob_v011831 [Colletotrichum orbiculare MAFF 240422]|uniref:Uncharacterized protein n=1 Tax=Colletotrichum orbiculare (strain 104-T / ATCC 96160 / CBS 514.97 / LARS 414 / MAFF 240422) TaxID=1213857 RepID=A0A484FBP6_COLOR|nr:hypothetical protein Cob_v011831 [Colletotrichum orbiculare MAFF 240422]